MPKTYSCVVVVAVLVPMVLSCSKREAALDSYNLGTEALEKEDYDLAITCFTEAIRLDPRMAEAYNNRAYAYSEKGDYDQAIADLTEAIRLDPNLAAAYDNRGRAYGDKGEFDKAIADHTKAIQLDPTDAVPYNNRGSAYADKGESDRAVADYTVCFRQACITFAGVVAAPR